MELFRALGSLVETPTPETASVAALLDLGPVPDPAEHSDLFLFQLYPFASVYLGVEGQLGGEARDRVAGFWRSLDEVPPAEPDHLAAMIHHQPGDAMVQQHGNALGLDGCIELADHDASQQREPSRSVGE